MQVPHVEAHSNNYHAVQKRSRTNMLFVISPGAGQTHLSEYSGTSPGHIYMCIYIYIYIHIHILIRTSGL